MKEAYIRFMAPVNPQTTDTLIRAIDERLKQGYTKLHLLVSSPGGSVFHGISLYNYLKGIPIDVATYNFGSVDSIGVVLFCAGKERFSVPNARFLIHGVTMQISGAISLDEKRIDEMLKSIRIDKSNIASIIAETTNKTPKSIFDIIDERKTLNPIEAKKFGLVTDIKTELIPKGAELYTINEIEPPPQQLPIQQIMPLHPAFMFPQSPQIVQKPQNKIDTYTSYFDRGVVVTN